MNDELNERLNETLLNLQFTVQEVNILLNVLNMPTQTPAMTLASFITAIQNQAGPQMEKAKTAFNAIKENTNEPQTAT